MFVPQLTCEVFLQLRIVLLTESSLGCLTMLEDVICSIPIVDSMALVLSSVITLGTLFYVNIPLEHLNT